MEYDCVFKDVIFERPSAIFILRGDLTREGLD